MAVHLPKPGSSDHNPSELYSFDFSSDAIDAMKSLVLHKDAFLHKNVFLNLYNAKDVEATMSMYNDADQELRQELAERKRKELLERKLELVEQYGTDTLSNGTILQFDKKFGPGGTVYTYAALKTNNTWYLTGERGLFGFTQGSWDELVLGLVGGEFPVSAEEIAIASSNLTPLLDSDASYNNEDVAEAATSYLD